VKSNLDVLRAIAVGLVLVDHVILYLTCYGKYTTTLAFSPLRLGRFGVLVFFIHTAYVLLLSLSRGNEENKFVQAWGFYVLRIFRIYPLVWVVVIACVMLHIPAAPAQPYIRPTTMALIANLSLFQNVAHVPSTIGPLWSLPYEIQMYIVIPCLFWSMRLRHCWFWLVLAYITSVAICLGGATIGIRGGFLLDFVPCFLAGGVAYFRNRSVRPIFPGALVIVFGPEYAK
jgi:peptidoglycan/LPS O-acetylase OafA/YrhL